MTQKQKQRPHHLAVAAMLTAVAAVLQFIEFAIPLMPAFIKLDISDLPALLGTFSLGPVYGVAIQLVKNLLHLPLAPAPVWASCPTSFWARFSCSPPV